MGPISSKQHSTATSFENENQPMDKSYVFNPSEMENGGLEMSEIPLTTKQMAKGKVTALCDICLRDSFNQRSGTSVCVQCDLYLCVKCTDTHELLKRHRCHKSENEEEVLNSFLTSFFNETHRRDAIKSECASICDEISVEHELDRKACFVMGMCGIGNNNMLAVVDWRNTCVKIVNLRTRLLDRYIRFNSTPCGVALIGIKADGTCEDPDTSLEAGAAPGFTAQPGSMYIDESGVTQQHGSSKQVDPHAQSGSNTHYSFTQQSDSISHSVCFKRYDSTPPAGFDNQPCSTNQSEFTPLSHPINQAGSNPQSSSTNLSGPNPQPRSNNQSGFNPLSSSTIQSNSYSQPCFTTDSALSQSHYSSVPHDYESHHDDVPSKGTNMTSRQHKASSGDSRVLAVTFPDRQQIVYIDCGTTPATRVKTIQMDTRPSRLEYFEGRLYVLSFDPLRSSPVFLINVMTLEGTILAILDTGIRVGKKYHHNSSIYFSQPDLCVLPGRIFINNPFKNEVKCIDFNGALVATQLVGNVNIGGIAADPGNGNLYARKDYKLYRLSSDLKHHMVVLDSTVFECYSGSLCHYNDKLYVSHADNLLSKNSILVIRLV